MDSLRLSVILVEVDDSKSSQIERAMIFVCDSCALRGDELI